MPPKKRTRDDVSPSATPQPPTKETLKTCDAYDSEDADIELISSDNVIFKVHSYRLQPVFRSMISMATTTSQRDPIVLTDPNIEHSFVVEEYDEEALDIIYNLIVDAPRACKSSNLFLYVVDFAKKWEMIMVTDIIGRELSRCIEGDKRTDLAFDSLLLALRLDDNSLASKSLQALDQAVWSRNQPKNTQMDKTDEGRNSAGALEFEREDGLPIHHMNDSPAQKLTINNPLAASPGGPVLDLRMMPYYKFIKLPPTVAWIILHATIDHKPGAGSFENKVKQLLDLAYPPSKPKDSSSKKRKAGE